MWIGGYDDWTPAEQREWDRDLEEMQAERKQGEREAKNEDKLSWMELALVYPKFKATGTPHTLHRHTIGTPQAPYKHPQAPHRHPTLNRMNRKGINRVRLCGKVTSCDKTPKSQHALSKQTKLSNLL